MDIESQQELQRELTPGERLLWSGRPRQGIRLRAADVFLIPFSLIWGGFAVFWEITVLGSGAPTFFALFGIPFVLIGLYITIGRFFVDSYQRSRTFYGVTDQRAIIRTPKAVKSLSLRGMADLSLKESGDRSGTISFGTTDLRHAFLGTGWPGAGRFQAPSFEMIEDARRVYAGRSRMRSGSWRPASHDLAICRPPLVLRDVLFRIIPLRH